MLIRQVQFTEVTVDGDIHSKGQHKFDTGHGRSGFNYSP